MGQTIAATRQVTDAELLAASRRGEHAAFGELVGRYQRVVSAVSYSRTRDRTLGEDVAQETFIAAWRQLDQLRETSRLRSWLCGIAANLASKAKRRATREVTREIAEPEIVARGTPFDDVSAAQAEHVVGEALSRVPENYRDVLVLYYQEQLSAREISETLGISEAAANQRLSRGRQYLADGVSSLVETSLRRPRRDLVAGVLAALPVGVALVPSRAEAATNASHGGSMFTLKMFVAGAALLAVAGTTTAIVIAQSSSHEPPRVVEAAITAPTPAPAPAKTHVAPRPQLQVKPRVQDDPDSRPARSEHRGLTYRPTIDADTIKQLKLDRGPSRGPVSAAVTIVMFTDLQCPYCAKSQGTLDQLFDEYPGKLRLIVKQLPVHKTAELGAEAALAADGQGKFWELNNLMIANHEDLSKDAILVLAKQAGLDVERLRKDLDSRAYAAALGDDRATAKKLEINATPSFVINGRRVTGALPIDEIRKTIDAGLKD